MKNSSLLFITVFSKVAKHYLLLALFLSFSLYADDNVIEPQNCIFGSVLGTRGDPSEITMGSGSTSYLENGAGCILNTSNVYSDNYGHGLECGGGMATASGTYQNSLAIDYGFTLKSANTYKKPGGGSSITVNSSNEVLTNKKYKNIKQDYHLYSFTWRPGGGSWSSIGVNKFDGMLNTVTIDNIGGRNLKIGQFITKSYNNTALHLTAVPKNIQIYKLQTSGSNNFSVQTGSTPGFEATDRIDIDTFTLKSSTNTDITLKAPTVVVRKMDLNNDQNHITIYADEIDIDEIDFGQHNTLTVHPYTAGGKVKFYSRQLNISSTTHMEWDGGDYYVEDFDIAGSGAGISFVNASGPDQIINLFVDPSAGNHDFEIGNNFGINSGGTNGDYGSNPAQNFRIFVNGDVTTGGGGTTFNAMVYAEGEADLGSPTYLKGALSTNNDITIGNGSHFEPADNGDWGQCPIQAQSDDICYGTLTYQAIGFGICMDFGIFKGGMNCRQTIPLQNISGEPLTNVDTYIDTTGMSGNFLGDCGIDGASGNCSEQSWFDMGPIGMFNQGLAYDMPDFATDGSHSIFEQTLMSMAIFSGQNLYATYEKNGVYYKDEIGPCSGGSSYSGFVKLGALDAVDAYPTNDSGYTYATSEPFNGLTTKVSKHQSYTLDVVWLGYDDVNQTSVTVEPYTPTQTTYPLFATLYLSDESCGAQEYLNPNAAQTAIVAQIANGNNHGTTNAFDLNAPVRRDARIKVIYTDWDQLFNFSNSNQNCLNHSNMSANLNGVPQCLNSEPKIKQVFPPAQYPDISTCTDAEPGYDAPCDSNAYSNGATKGHIYPLQYNNDFGCMLCLTQALGDFSTCSRDNFAIRPYAFRTFGKNQYKRAGEDFNVTVKAVDENNYNIISGTVSDVTGVNEYNASLSDLNMASNFYTPSDADIYQMQQDTGANDVTTCPNAGTFTINNSSDSFVNGEVNASLKFSETGILDLNVSEKPGSEWALVDQDDTNDTLRYIKKSTAINDRSDISRTDLLLFVPYALDTTAHYSATNAKSWLYMHGINGSNSTFTTPEMAAYIAYTITAKNKDGATTKNFTKTCFPDTSESNCPRVNGLKLNTTFDLFLDADIYCSADANISLYTEDNNSIPIWVLQQQKTLIPGINQTREWISPLNFEQGIGQAKVYFNIDRKMTHPRNPIILRVIDANTSTSWMDNPGSPKAFNGSDINQTKIYLYGRTHAPRYRVECADSNASCSTTTSPNQPLKIYEEFYYDLGATIDSNTTLTPLSSGALRSVDSINWYVNSKHNTQSDGKISQVWHYYHDTNVTNSPISVTGATSTIAAGVSTINATYNGNNGYPYKATMGISASPWLIYNHYDGTATHNDFELEFNAAQIGGDANITNTSDKNLTAPNTSRRIQW